MQRTQIYLDDEQHRALTALARERGATASSLIRSAIDQYLAGQLSPGEKLEELKRLGARFTIAADDQRSNARETVDNIRAAERARLNSSG